MIGFSVIIFLSLILYYLPYIRFLDKFNFKKVLICMLIGILFLNTVDVQAIAGVSVNVINSILKSKTKVKVGIGDTAKVVGSNDFLEGFYYGTNQVGNEIYVNEKSINVNGKDIVAYCLDQTKTGPDTSGYDVTFTDNLDSILHEVLMRGYPKKSAQDLGLNSDKDAYFVTAMAVYMNTNYSNLNLWHITSGDDHT